MGLKGIKKATHRRNSHNVAGHTRAGGEVMAYWRNGSLVSSYHRRDRYIPFHRRRGSLINPSRQAGLLPARALLDLQRDEKRSARVVLDKVTKLKREIKAWKR